MLAGVVPTPLISHYTKEKGIAGIMITASHNPYHDNGIKVIYKGNKLSESQEEQIEAFVDGNREFSVTKVGDLVSGEEVVDLYADLIDRLEIEPMDIRLAYDSANGANYLLSKAIFDQIVAEAHQIGFMPDGKNINDGVGSTHLDSIQSLVQEKACDIGLSFDGDGDRILVVDHDGTIIDGDELIYILASYLQDQNKLNHNTVVLTKMSNLGIIKAFENRGISVVLTNVGDKYVLEELNKNNYSIGGENSGHIILKDYINTGDGLLVGAFLLKVLYETGKTLKELTKDLKMWPQEMKNIRTFNKEILQDKRVVDLVEKISNELGSDGKVLVRASGTEPLVRVTLSCETQEQLDKYMDQIVSMIELVKEEV
jgi:phosphoglucosamine mutase